MTIFIPVLGGVFYHIIYAFSFKEVKIWNFGLAWFKAT
jgi:hypothetical protein